MAKNKITDKIMIKVEDVSKAFNVPHEKSNSLKSSALSVLSLKKAGFTRFEALNNISFEVKEGEFFGIIGRNGSGKSTLLKMLAGIYVPDHGKLQSFGRISPFLELGVGFNPELSGRENVYLNGAILGLSRKEIDSKYEEIVEFAELEEFMDQKLKNYSSGMQVRLAFAVSIKAHAEILLIDEVLAVGDSNFQKKCFNVFKKFKEEGKTIVFVSHSMESVKEFCDRVLVIDDSRNIYLGKPEKAAEVYNGLNFKNIEVKATPLSLKNGPVESEDRWGNFEMYLKEAVFKNKEGARVSTLITGQSFTLELHYLANKDVENFVFGLGLIDDNQSYLFGTNSVTKMLPRKIKKGEGVITINFENPPILRGYLYFDILFLEKNENNRTVLDQLSRVEKIYFEAGDTELGGTINFEVEFGIS